MGTKSLSPKSASASSQEVNSDDRFNFNQWAEAVKPQLIAALRRRGAA